MIEPIRVLPDERAAIIEESGKRLSGHSGGFSRGRFEAIKNAGKHYKIKKLDWIFLMDYVDYLHLEIEGLEKEELKDDR